MWSDPEDIETWIVSNRGAGYLFGWRVVNEVKQKLKQFNHLNDLDLICRAHQLVMEGYKYWFKDANLVTVWSAPNYCYRCGNKASILKLNEKLERTFEIFNDVPESLSTPNPKQIVPYFL